MAHMLVLLTRTPYRKKMPPIKQISKTGMANICRSHLLYLIKSTLEKYVLKDFNVT